MANLQDQLGLGLAVKQTAQQNNTPNYSANSVNSLTWQTQITAWREIPFESQIDLWGGAPFNYWPGGAQDHTMDSIDYSGNKIPSWYAPQSFSASSGVTTPSVTNMSIWDTFSWITPKRDKNIAQTAWQVGIIPPVSGVPTVPVSPTLDINKQQRLANIAKRQWVAGVQPPITPEKPEISPTWLQGAELQAYNQLTPQEQKTFQALATQGIKAQTDYLQHSKAAQEYKKEQERLYQETDTLRDQAEDIQARQQLESAAKQVANLKQNIGYLWSQGQPGVSATKLDAVSNQVALAQKTYDDIIKIDQLNKANRALGQQSHALQFTREMTQLQDDLDSKVNKGIQSALNQFNAAELKGKLDTIPEIEAFQQQLYAQLDGDLSSIMDTNIEARKFLIERYDKLAESHKTQLAAQTKAKEEMTKRANTVNKEMSQARGYYVNENGDPLIDQKTGGYIVVPPEATTNYDASTGQMIIMTKNRDGSVWVQMKQVWSPKATYQKVGTDPNTGEDIYGFVNQQAQTVTPYTGWGSIDKNTAIQKYGSTPAVRNFNPGNIMDTGFGGQKVPGERFTVFNSPQEGFSALVAKIQNIQNGNSKVYSPNDTLLQYISKYAPSSDNNNPQAYAQGIANNLGISINTKIWQIDPTKLALEHARHEDGNSYRMLQDLGITWKSQGTQQSQDMKMQAQALVQWLGGTEWERNKLVNNIVNTAQKNNISLVDAKKKLWYKTADDVEFAKTRALEFKTIKNDTRDKLSNANTALTLLNSPQTAIWDVASVVWFLKTIDPASVARESEVAAVENARGIIDSIWNIFQKADQGTKLTDGQRKQLKDSIQTIVDAGNAKYKDYVNTTVDEFEQRGLDPTVYFPQKTIDDAVKWTVKWTQKKLWITWWLKDFMSELTTLLQ